MTAVEAVVFDNDGTLLDTEQAWTRAEVALFARRGREFTAQDKRTLLGSSPTTAARMLGEMLGEDGSALVDELYAIVMDEARAGVDPRPGARALVGALRARGVPMAVASNSARPFLELVLDGAGWLHDGSFIAVLSATDASIEHAKPAPDIYLAACAQLGADPARSAALEDSPTGVESAVAAGLTTIGVPYFADTPLPGAHVIGGSLDDPVVLAALGLDGSGT